MGGRSEVFNVRITRKETPAKMRKEVEALFNLMGQILESHTLPDSDFKAFRVIIVALEDPLDPHLCPHCTPRCPCDVHMGTRCKNVMRMGPGSIRCLLEDGHKPPCKDVGDCPKGHVYPYHTLEAKLLREQGFCQLCRFLERQEEIENNGREHGDTETKTSKG